MILDCHISLVAAIDAFLEKSGMSASYFGKVAAGNSKVVGRLKSGKTITVVIEQKLLKYIADHPCNAEKAAGGKAA